MSESPLRPAGNVAGRGTASTPAAFGPRADTPAINPTVDPTITLPWVQEITALYSDDEIIRARNATLLARPDNVKAYFTSQFRKIIPAQTPARPMAASIKSAPENDPYGF